MDLKHGVGEAATLLQYTLDLQQRLSYSLCTCAGLRLAQLPAGPRAGKGKIGSSLAWWAPGTSQSSDEQRPRATVSQIALYHRRSSQIATWHGLCTAVHACETRGATGPPPPRVLLFAAIPSHCAVSPLISCSIKASTFPDDHTRSLLSLRRPHVLYNQSLFLLCCSRRGNLPFNPKTNQIHKQTPPS